MRLNRFNLIWGIALIAAGVLFLAQNLGYFGEIAPQFWAVFFAALSLLSFASYFANGLRQWGWLFPALGSAGIALTIFLATAGVTGSWIGAPILGAIAVPFLVGFAFDPRRNWGLLIPAWVMGVLTVVTIIADRVPGELTGAVVLFAIGLPFWVVFFVNRRENWWALIPGSIMVILGFIPLLTLRYSGNLLGAAIMFLFALPFLVVYFWSRANWWALIPAGAMTSVGVLILVATTGGQAENPNPGLLSAIIFIGMALTFLLLWIQRAAIPTAWAIYPGVVLSFLGVVAFGFGATGVNVVWPIAIIALGVLLLYGALHKRPGI